MIQIALAYSKESAAELEKMGFKKEEVYTKSIGGISNKVTKYKGESEFFLMKHKPWQFLVADFWGCGPE